MDRDLTPLDVLEALIGKPSVLQRELGWGQKVYNWKHESRGRKRGKLELDAQVQALAYLSAKDIPHKGEWLIVGASVAEIKAARDDMLARGLTPPPFQIPGEEPTATPEAAE